MRLPLTIETNFSLKIPGLIHQENTLEELRNHYASRKVSAS